METNKNLCALIPLALHNRVREEQEKSGQTLSAYITNVLTSYYESEENAMKINDKHGNQVSAHGLGKSPKQVVEMSRRGVTTERQRKMRTKTHSQNSTNFGCTNVLFLVQKQSYAPSIRIIIDESTRQFNMIFDRASFDAVSFLYNLIRFNTIFRTIFRVCCMFRFSTLQ